MKNAHAQGRWTVSEVEHLTGLSRRDIQRCCYQGKGGVGILEPQDSSWGRRSYSVTDIATLYVVQLEKQSGLSLPEIGQKFQRNKDRGEFDVTAALKAHKARMEEQLERLSGHVLTAIALLESCENNDSESLGELFEHELAAQIEDIAFAHRHIELSKRQTNDLANEEHLRSARAHCRCALPAGWFTIPISQATRNDDTWDARALQDSARKAFANVIDCLRANNDFPTCVDARRAIAFALDAPGMDLTLELWLGPGASDLIKRAVQ